MLNDCLRPFLLCALAVGAFTLAAGSAYASDTPAQIDSSWPNPQPAYPASARASGEQGTVLLDVYVRPSGHISKFRVAQSSGFGDLDEAAAETVLNWHFVPAMRDGDKVSDWTTVKIVFQLPQSPAPTPPPPAK